MWQYFKKKKDEIIRNLLRPIPEEFFSLETGEPFAECVECQRHLGGKESDYMIEKCYQDGEVIIEYALCDECGKSLRKEMSKESTKYLKKALRRSVLKTTTDGCRSCGIPKHELPSYTIVGACVGDSMLFWNVPILICEPCLEVISEGLSKETRDMMDDFEERNFPGPPELELDLPRPKRKVVLL